MRGWPSEHERYLCTSGQRGRAGCPAARLLSIISVSCSFVRKPAGMTSPAPRAPVLPIPRIPPSSFLVPTIPDVEHGETGSTRNIVRYSPAYRCAKAHPPSLAHTYYLSTELALADGEEPYRVETKVWSVENGNNNCTFQTFFNMFLDMHLKKIIFQRQLFFMHIFFSTYILGITSLIYIFWNMFANVFLAILFLTFGVDSYLKRQSKTVCIKFNYIG